MRAWLYVVGHRKKNDEVLGRICERSYPAAGSYVHYPLFAPSVLNGVFPPLEAAHGRAGRADAAG